jgi:membrane protein YqaA with SNARE-associated domain
MIYLNIFFISLISATLFPAGSEALFIYYINENYNITLLLLFATVGNSLGSIINYFLGKQGYEYLENKKIINKKKFLKAKKHIVKYGYYSLLLSWVPIIGDPITFVAGILKLDILKFILIVTMAKFIRYFALYLIII